MLNSLRSPDPRNLEARNHSEKLRKSHSNVKADLSFDYVYRQNFPHDLAFVLCSLLIRFAIIRKQVKSVLVVGINIFRSCLTRYLYLFFFSVARGLQMHLVSQLGNGSCFQKNVRSDHAKSTFPLITLLDAIKLKRE